MKAHKEKAEQLAEAGWKKRSQTKDEMAMAMPMPPVQTTNYPLGLGTIDI